jgi:hypothetical protein
MILTGNTASLKVSIRFTSWPRFRKPWVGSCVLVLKMVERSIVAYTKFALPFFDLSCSI